MPRSKPFTIATEGATTDGRTIKREWISQMAESYDPKAFTALGNLEHYLSMQPDSQFSAYGKVLELGTRETELLGEKKLQLTAIFDANDAIVAMQKTGKKMFCSIEINPNFAATGKAYLQGLAFTDTPASLGTEVMEFAAQAKNNPFASRKKDANNLFTAAEEIAIEFEDEQKPTAGENLFTKVKELLGLGKKDADERYADIGQAVELVAASQKQSLANFARIESELKAFTDKINQLDTDMVEQQKNFAALLEKLGQTADGSPPRPAATGGNGQVTTDC